MFLWIPITMLEMAIVARPDLLDETTALKRILVSREREREDSPIISYMMDYLNGKPAGKIAASGYER